jgi:hypothetical protein
MTTPHSDYQYTVYCEQAIEAVVRKCTGCNCPQGQRTGEIHAYQVVECVGDFHADELIALCEDCVRAAGNEAMAHLIELD